jgi:hypothetical protein
VESELEVGELVSALSHLIGRLGPLTRSVGGTIAFAVRGEGCWLVDLDESGGRWSELGGGAVPRASTIVRATRASFPAILLSPAEIPRLLERGEMAVVGDRSKLLRLGELMEEGRSVIGVRVRQKKATKRS